jgi:hypothetical protein
MAVPRARRSRLICAVSDSRSASRVADGRDGGGGTAGVTPNRSAVSLLRATRSCWLQSICDQSGPCEEEADVGCAVATLRTASSSQMRRYSPAVAKTRMKAPRSVVDVPQGRTRRVRTELTFSQVFSSPNFSSPSLWLAILTDRTCGRVTAARAAADGDRHCAHVYDLETVATLRLATPLPVRWAPWPERARDRASAAASRGSHSAGR